MSTSAHGSAFAIFKTPEFDKGQAIKSEYNQYSDLFKDDETGEKRKSNYMTMVNNFYDLVTDFYEYGWGQSFHFANRYKDESFMESLRRSEDFLALKLQLKPGMKVLDIGCGVGGPMRQIAKVSGANITGINNNEYQIKRATRHNASVGLSQQCDFVQSDFMNLKVPANSYDGAFAIEATCHAPDKVACFKQIYQALKPGGLFVGYEWCMTPKYDPKNPVHQEIKFGIEEGNGLPDIVPEKAVDQALKDAGFELIEAFDTHTKLHDPSQIPWYRPLSSDITFDGILNTKLGHYITHSFVYTMEAVGFAPKGSTDVSNMLKKTATYLVQGGKLEIFTPDYFFLARKPLNA